MEIVEKLRVMLPHWIDHNRGHAEEFAKWADEIAETDAELAGELRRAVHSLEHAQEALQQALQLAGGPAKDTSPSQGHHHHHHH